MNLETSRDSKREPSNTNIKALSQPNQIKNWCFTFNNYSEDDILLLESKFKEICDKYIFEREIGECGTPHIQGFISLKKAMRWTEFKLPKEIHWEKCKNVEASIQYCQKDYGKGITPHIYFLNVKVTRPLKLITPDRPYQKQILEIIEKEPDERKIHWFYEKRGNVGKSSFTKYLVVKHNAIFIDEGKKTDLMNTCLTNYNNGHPMNFFILDIPRANKNCISYKSIESIKTGLIYSPKYEGGQAVFNSPHIIIFSNYPPEIQNLSLDRWEIFEIQEDFSTKKINADEIE